MFQAALLLWSFLASHSFTVGNAIQHDAIFKMACNHLLFTIIFKQAAPTEPVGYIDCGLNMPLACPYKQGAALQPGGWTTRRLAELRLSFVLFVYPLWSRSCGMVRSFGPLRHQKLRHSRKRISRITWSNLISQQTPRFHRLFTIHPNKRMTVPVNDHQFTFHVSRSTISHSPSLNTFALCQAT